MNYVRLLGVVACIALVNACSPYLYKQEIQGFNKQSEKLGSAINVAQETSDNDYVAGIEAEYQQKQASVSTAVAVRLHKNCTGATNIGGDPQLSDGLRCAVVEDDPNTQQVHFIPANPETAAFVRTSNVMAAVDRYTNSLVAITDAEDRKALDNAAQELCAAVGAIAGVAGGLVAGPLAAPAGGALCGLATQAYSIWLDHQRLTVLREGVVTANKEIIPKFGLFLGEVLEEARQGRISQLREIAQRDAAALPGAAQSSLRPGGTATVAYSPSYSLQFRRLIQIAGILNELEILDARAAPQAFVKAHDELAIAISSNRGQTAAVFESIYALGEQAKKLREAFQPAEG